MCLPSLEYCCARLRVLLLAVCMLFGATAHADDLTDAMTITTGGIVFNRTTNTFDSAVLITSRSARPLSLPFRLIVANLPAQVLLANKTGNAADGLPYIDVSSANGVFNQGQTLSTILKFNNPSQLKFSVSLSFSAQVSAFDPYMPKTMAGRFATVSSCGPSNIRGTVTITQGGEYAGSGCYAGLTFGPYRSPYEYLYAPVASGPNEFLSVHKYFLANNLSVNATDNRLLVTAGFGPGTRANAGAIHSSNILEIDPTARLLGWLDYLSNRPCSARLQSGITMSGTIERTSTDITIRSGNVVLQSIPLVVLLNLFQFSYHELLRSNDTLLVTGAHLGDSRINSVTINMANPSSTNIKFEFALSKPNGMGQFLLARCNN